MTQDFLFTSESVTVPDNHLELIFKMGRCVIDMLCPLELKIMIRLPVFLPLIKIIEEK